MAVSYFLCLLIIYFQSACAVRYDITEVCEKEFDLNFKFIGYVCSFRGEGTYIFKDLGHSESGDATISFDMINIQTFVLIQTPIRKLEIRRGVMELCSNIFTTNRGILITINGQECATDHDVSSITSTADKLTMIQTATQTMETMTETITFTVSEAQVSSSKAADKTATYTYVSN
ncbi:unnamed protein product [Mytilus coruscus]|uniref:Uncharacterized protein n=1 Tax=Mytilus coruscus TaxID=42192 RepID=A0A6J8AJ60_MYTCO|nr:unnamed protein product [Mytilus coruscus]